tara:strand:+ start:11685 stop:12080 length:396 start_codon:yes stop_codon:yes gene_type:complete
MKKTTPSQYAIDRQYQIADAWRFRNGKFKDYTLEEWRQKKKNKNPAVASSHLAWVITQWNDEFFDREFGFDRVYGKDLLLKKIALVMKYEGKWHHMTKFKEPWDLIEALEDFASGMQTMANFMINNPRRVA